MFREVTTILHYLISVNTMQLMINCYKDKKEYVLSLKDPIALLVHCDLLNHDYQMIQFSSDTHDVLINQTTKKSIL